ncbi:MAG TPA: hypothetical protein VGE00_05985 [Gammaproteobacteria bacterium]
MISETLIHINETLSEQQRLELLRYLGNRDEAIHAHHHTEDPHLLFVAYDPDESCPRDLVEIIKEQGLHAQVIDL